MKINYIKDYYERIYELYPNINKKDINKILNIGWRNFYMLNSMGGDVMISIPRQGFKSYCGKLKYNALDHFKQYVIKLLIKIRRRFIKSKKVWDGYYYFALTNSQYENLLKQKNKKGRKKKYLNYGDCLLYKLYDECSLVQHNRQHIFKIFYGINLGYTYFKHNLISDKVIELEERKILTFKDIMTTNKKFDI